jgi:hypothetical protein
MKVDAFMQIDCKEIRNSISQKMKENQVNQEGDIRYYNFVVMNLIEKINPENYADFGFSKVLANYFNVPINMGASKLTLDDFNKVNKTMSEFEKLINDEVKTKGAIYLARNEDNFSIMYYEVLN